MSFNPGVNGTLKATHKPAALVELALLLAADEQLNETHPDNVQIMVDVQEQATVIVARIPFQVSKISNGMELVSLDYTVSSTPTPTPSTPSAAGVVYTFTQSDAYGAGGTYTTLTDGDGTTGTITYPGHSGWLQATFPYPVLVSSVQVGGGNLPNIGTIANLINVSHVQYSTDNASWTTVWDVSGVADSGSNQFVTHQLTAPITARYWRLINFADKNTGYHVGASEFKFT